MINNPKNNSVPPIGQLKTYAKRLRTELSDTGVTVSHSKSLEMIAHQYGFKDWNHLSAVAPSEPTATRPNALVPHLKIGQTIEATYLGQKCVGEIIGLQKLSAGDRYHLTLHLNKAVDVVTFDSFSALRTRISCRVDAGGVSAEKTSNGQPQMVLGAVQ